MMVHEFNFRLYDLETEDFERLRAGDRVVNYRGEWATVGSISGVWEATEVGRPQATRIGWNVRVWPDNGFISEWWHLDDLWEAGEEDLT